MPTKYLATKQSSLKISELVCACMHGDLTVRAGFVIYILLTWCLDRTWSVILQPILQTLLRKPVPVEAHFLLLCDGKLRLYHAPAANRQDLKCNCIFSALHSCYIM